MGANILPGRNRRARRGRWTGFGLAHAAERKISKGRQCPGGYPGAFQECASVETIVQMARFVADIRSANPTTRTTFRLPDQQRRLPYRAG